ncbi:MAG: phenylalanine--tRNA ligase subunit beta [Candidatus Kaiserbacteria bacterium]|nr:MAG: phenylalanine--tRNA ligase subunit beta [Candidatus Kaiserbacteria bacterium]
MKISRNWLQNYFEAPLPSAEQLADALTFHAFEIESVEKVGSDDVLDVKVTPNRGHDCLSHRGIAAELSAILEIPLNAERDPLAKLPDLSQKTDAVKVLIDDTNLCKRFTAAYITGITVGPSPEWLVEALHAVGQKTINNVVDATNLVMFNTGQPLHAFDARRLTQKDGYFLHVRSAKSGEKMLGLDDKQYALTPSTLLIADGHTKEAVSIAGIKGGKPTGIDETTVDVILEAANWDGPMIRKTSQALKLRTDASDRFQQIISPELCAYGLRQTVDLVAAIAGGELHGFVDEYPAPQERKTVSVSLEKINKVLGTNLDASEVESVFRKLALTYRNKNGEYAIDVPFQRLDLNPPAGGPEDLIEEVGRIVGYEKVPATPLPPFSKKPEINAHFYAAERVREDFVSKGYSEVYTSVFAEKGERAVLNKVGGERPYLRTTLVDGLREALERNARSRDLLGLKEVKLFEIGTVWKGGKELTMVGSADSSGMKEALLQAMAAERYDDLPISQTERYQPFSKYPFIVRDISMWVPDTSNSFTEVISLFAAHSQGLLRHVELFDQFKKEGRVSYAFRLVLQSFEKTLTDEEANAVMDRVQKELAAKGFEIR